MGMRRWEYGAPDAEKVRALAGELDIPPLVSSLLISRGMDTAKAAQGFLLAKDILSDPFSILDMDRAVERIHQAVDQGEPICIYGDYDCDGITSTVMLYRYLESVGAEVSYYVPNREDEGYGMNCGALEKIAQKGVRLIVTVDNGISAAKEVAFARELGMDVVVTDHHQPPEELPDAAAVVDPHRRDCPSSFKDLAGVGVAFQLICALEDDRDGEMLEYYADWAALGTVADVVPLVGENRVIVRRGLEQLPQSDNVGLQALICACGLEDKPLRAENIAFILAPRINAASRMGCVEKVLELFFCEDEEQAQLLAQEVCGCNSARQKEEQKILEDTARVIAEDPMVLYDRILVLAGEGWHHGVIGIVCSKLVERYGKPCLLVSTSQGEGRGSGRSVPGFSLIDAVSRCGDLLEKFGGHPAAVGFSLQANQVEEFRRAVNRAAAQLSESMPCLSLFIDRTAAPSELTMENIRPMELLEPFGAQNEEPVFALLSCRIEGVYAMSEGRHLRLKLSLEGQGFYAVYFGMPVQSFLYGVGDLVDLAVSCSISVWQEEERVTIRIRDLRPAKLDQEGLLGGWQDYDRCRRGEKPLFAESIPDREKIARVYRGIRSEPAPFGDYGQLFGRMQGEGLNYCSVRLSVEVLRERGLVQLGRSKAGLAARVIPDAPRADLEASPIMKRLQTL
ncbi:MAG: single-stranded-DNA-specific exonuclease RecJ [Oscillospiraceae bacterium]|nr:single-stranded-DNA-specific exonuclease RecJ [Oscillospiraceae bacterium]